MTYQKLEQSCDLSGTKSNITQNIQISILNFNDENYALSDATKDKIVDQAIDLASCGKLANNNESLKKITEVTGKPQEERNDKKNSNTVLLEPEEDDQFEFVNTNASNRVNDTLIWSFESQKKKEENMTGTFDSINGNDEDEKLARKAPLDK